jgi:hypothetical protein
LAVLQRALNVFPLEKSAAGSLLIRVLHVPPAYTGLIFAIAAIGGIAWSSSPPCGIICESLPCGHAGSVIHEALAQS